jgi:hypothetical protein
MKGKGREVEGNDFDISCGAISEFSSRDRREI